MTLIHAIFFSYAALFPIVNPIGGSIIFFTLVKGTASQEINALALKISLYTVVMLLIVLLVGSWILSIFGVSIPIVLISGGLLLTQVGWQMLNKPHEESTGYLPTNKDTKLSQLVKIEDPRAFYPLTFPVTAGPTCIAITIAIGAHDMQNLWEIKVLAMLGSAIGVVLIGLSIFFCYRYAHYFFEKLKEPSRNVAMSLAAFINVCIGLQIVWHGIDMLLPK